MAKFYLPIIFLLLLGVLSGSVFAQGQPSLQLKNLNPQVVPPAGPPARPPTSGPTGASPDLCKSLYAIKFGGAGDDFIYVTPNADYVRSPAYIRDLKTDPKFGNLTGQTEAEISVLYASLAQKLYYPDGLRLPVGMLIKSRAEESFASLNSQNFPKFQHTVLGFNLFGPTAYAAQYRTALTLQQALADLGCPGVNPKTHTAFTPLIYLYPEVSEEVHLKFTDQDSISFTSPVYSFTRGIDVKADPSGSLHDFSGKSLGQDYIYYESLKDNINYEILNIKYQVVVAGDKLEEHLFHALLPKLSLTLQELADYKEDIKKELISHIPSHISHLTSPITHYQISLIQSSSLDYLIPLTVTPKPDTVIRNMIVVKKVETLTYPSPITHYSFPRQGFTLVENGIMVIP